MSTSVLGSYLRRILKPNFNAERHGQSTGSLTEVPNDTSSTASKAISSRDYMSRPLVIDEIEIQQQLLILAPSQPFHLKHDATIPSLSTAHEVLIRIESIGLNPIDWKSPAFGFGLPSLPCVLGRDFLGTIVKSNRRGVAEKGANTILKSGDVVLAISTDYRDYRKAAFQQYAVAADFNLCRVPSKFRDVSPMLPALGVAFVTAALSLGLCLGLDFHGVGDAPGPDLYKIVHALSRNEIAEDVREECFDAISQSERIQQGDWLAIWGASSTVGFLTLQLAKLAGLKVVCVANVVKHGSLLIDAGADALVSRSDPEVIDVIRGLMKGRRLRYGIDTVGKDTVELLQSTFDEQASHLICLVGAPKYAPGHVKYHTLPIKIFHESPVIGRALMLWLEDLLYSGALILPKTDVHGSRGLGAVNGALTRLREGDLVGQRIVVQI